ncbi:cytochrome b6 [Prolixibacter sp. NT017]|nr:cytochrome b6 [Prolixibacter sp. NT017]
MLESQLSLGLFVRVNWKLNNDKFMDRRKALQQMVAGSATLFVVPSALAACGSSKKKSSDTSPLTVNLDDAKFASLKEQGGSVVTDNTIIINTAADGIVALSSICTHKGCTVGYDKAHKDILCPCHRSEFAFDGSVLQGPATKPLPKYKVTRNGDTLTIDRS